MANFATLKAGELPALRQMDKRLVSYNIEMTEVTGGTFWKSYTPEQVDGTEDFPPIADWSNMGNLQQWFDPIDLYNPRLRKLAKELGPAWVRVSGTWANKTYYDFDGHCNGVVPKGFQNVLTQNQWKGVLDFVKAVDAKLLVSVANCPGIHSADEPWSPEQAKLLFDYSKNYGVPIDAVEFTNEPNMPTMSGQPSGYTSAHFNRDHNLFVRFIRENYPEVLIAGPCTVGDFNLFAADESQSKGDAFGGGLAAGFETWTTEELMDGFTEKLDIFSYHYYNGVSERGAAMGGHWPAGKTLTESYLSIAGECARFYAPRRDRYAPGSQMWVTESGDAGGGGNTWASTYLDVPRTLNELGEFCTITDGVIFHNTLASSDYGFLQHGSFEPRPNFFAALLWKRLMGDIVYDAGIPIREGVHIYAHSRRDGLDGVAYLVINNSMTDTATVGLPKTAQRYTLSGDGKLRSRTMCLNGTPLMLGVDDSLPELEPVAQSAGSVKLAPGTCTFFVL